MKDLLQRHELQIVDLTEQRSARQRAEWLMELADIQEFSLQRIGQRYFDWGRLSATADEAAEVFAQLEGGRDYSVQAA